MMARYPSITAACRELAQGTGLDRHEIIYAGTLVVHRANCQHYKRRFRRRPELAAKEQTAYEREAQEAAHYAGPMMPKLLDLERRVYHALRTDEIAGWENNELRRQRTGQRI